MSETKTPSFEVFVLTYNRAELLREALLSLLNQTISDFDITVLDNGSTDNTAAVVEQLKKEFPNHRLFFNSLSQNEGAFTNFQRAQKLAQKDYCMLFHDDDILHPQYIEKALQLLKKHSDADILSCANISTPQPAQTPWKKITGKYFCLDKAAFAAYLTCYKSFTYSATIYRSKRLKDINPRADLYGKISDRPYLMDVLSNTGTAIVLKNPYIKYRLHCGQDSQAKDTGPFEKEILNTLKKYKDESAKFSYMKALYPFFMYEKLWMFYRWIVKNQMTFSEFEDKCVKNGILNKKQRFFSKRNFIYKIFKQFYVFLRNFYFRKYERIAK